MDRCKIELQPIGRQSTVPIGMSIIEAALKSGVTIASDCGGRGACGRCRVEVLSGEVTSPDTDELKVLANHKALTRERLACRTLLRGDAKVFVPKTSAAYNHKLQLPDRLRSALGERRYTVVHVDLPPPSLVDQRSDVKRLLDALPHFENCGEWQASPDFVRRLSEVSRSSGWRFAVFLYEGVPVGIGPMGKVPMGIAVDVGTTKIAGLIVDLLSGEEICSEGVLNPQISYGADVISRLNYAIQEEKGGRELHRLLCNALDDLIEMLCHKGDVSAGQVMEITVCANTAMSHLLLRLPPEPLARSPYVAGFSTLLETMARTLGIKNTPEAKVLILPCIGGFIGGDHVAMILACNLDRCTDTTLGIDIGTNTEIVLAKPGSDGGLFTASCASGPAFEGAHICDGMRAATGAIEKFCFSADGPIITTVGAVPPIGLCGSGLVDALSELVRIGVIDERGHLQESPHLIHLEQNSAAYVLVPANASGTGRDILLTQKDISAVQLAKGAIQAGIRTLLAKTETSAEEVDFVYLAGAFGSYININNALSIGLLPDLPKARFIQAGNAAAAGAVLTLLSKEERNRAAKIALQSRQVELASDPQFTRLFVRAMRFEKKHSPPPCVQANIKQT